MCYKSSITILLFLAVVLTGCRHPSSQGYQEMYAHLKSVPKPSTPLVLSDYFLVIFVEARHLDYTNNRSFLRTVAKHPSDGSKNRDVGHAWIYLQGNVNGESICLHGGHSGETGRHQARYFDGIMNNLEYGCANPQPYQYHQKEVNPIKYLWEVQRDGFFQYGSGGHRATYAAKIDLTSEQFQRIWDFIRSYPFSEYSLTGKQCSSFIVQLASFAGLDLECEVTMQIDPVLYLRGEALRLWEDPLYSQLTIATPDILEKSLMQAVSEGRAQYVNPFKAL